jgi:hypothetical protein
MIYVEKAHESALMGTGLNSMSQISLPTEQPPYHANHARASPSRCLYNDTFFCDAIITFLINPICPLRNVYAFIALKFAAFSPDAEDLGCHFSHEKEQSKNGHHSLSL